MPLRLAFDLRIEERGARRVVVSVLLAPDGEPAAHIDGVALQLQSRTADPLGVQVVLPIAGDLRQPLMFTVELRLDEEIPQGSRVVGTAWDGPEQREAAIPTDPFTELEVHMRARRRIAVAYEDVELESVIPEERALVARDFPWIDQPLITPAAPQLTVVDSDEPETVEDMVNGLGLDHESAAWLEELLTEDPLRE